jgi:hypothetical protein
LLNTYKAVGLILCTVGKKDWSGEEEQGEEERRKKGRKEGGREGRKEERRDRGRDGGRKIITYRHIAALLNEAKAKLSFSKMWS